MEYVEFDPLTEDGPPNGGRLDEADHPPENDRADEPADAGDGGQEAEE